MVSNNTKVWLFILLISLLWLFFGYEIGERLGLLFGFLSAILFNFFVFYHDESKVLAQLNAVLFRGQDAWGLNEKVQRLSHQLNIPAPKIYITPHAAINTFCVTGTLGKKSLGFTSGLLQTFNDEELEAVVANQLCHTKRFDSVRFGIGNSISNSILGVGYFLDTLLPKNVKFFIPILTPLAWIFIRLAYGDKPIFENDLTAAKLLDSRLKLGEVLWRLEGIAKTRPLHPPPCTSHLFMVNPEGMSQKNLFLKSHPAVDLRLKRLLGYYPI